MGLGSGLGLGLGLRSRIVGIRVRVRVSHLATEVLLVKVRRVVNALQLRHQGLVRVRARVKVGLRLRVRVRVRARARGDLRHEGRWVLVYLVPPAWG